MVSANGSASAEFIQELKRVVEHLYDPQVLRSSPLRKWCALGSGPMPLSQMIIEAIEALRPPVSESENPRAWRKYRALQHRYVECFPQSQVAENLSISVRQLRREEHAGILALGDYLWSQTETDAGHSLSAEPSDEPGPVPGRDSELAWLANTGERELVPICEVLENVLQVVDPLRSRLNTTVRLKIMAAGAIVLANRSSLRQALIHALASVLRHALGSAIQVRLEQDGSEVWVQLIAEDYPRDEAGDGRPDDDWQVVQDLVSLSMGRVENRSAWAGRGVHIAIVLPAAAAPKKVVVVDDNPDTLLLYQRHLESTRYQCTAISDPAAALSALEQNRADLIVLDVMLPGMDGWELLGRVGHHPRTADVPVVVCSILPDQELAVALGARAFLSKPFSRSELLSVLDSLV